MIALLVYCSLLVSCRAGYAPKDAPKLPEGFCPSDTGDVTGIISLYAMKDPRSLSHLSLTTRPSHSYS